MEVLTNAWYSTQTLFWYISLLGCLISSVAAIFNERGKSWRGNSSISDNFHHRMLHLQTKQKWRGKQKISWGLNGVRQACYTFILRRPNKEEYYGCSTPGVMHQTLSCLSLNMVIYEELRDWCMHLSEYIEQCTSFTVCTRPIRFSKEVRIKFWKI